MFRGNPFQVHSLEQSYHLAFLLYFASSLLISYSRINKKYIFSRLKVQIIELNLYLNLTDDNKDDD